MHFKLYNSSDIIHFVTRWYYLSQLVPPEIGSRSQFSLHHLGNGQPIDGQAEVHTHLPPDVTCFVFYVSKININPCGWQSNLSKVHFREICIDIIECGIWESGNQMPQGPLNTTDSLVAPRPLKKEKRERSSRRRLVACSKNCTRSSNIQTTVRNWPLRVIVRTYQHSPLRTCRCR